MAEALRTQTVTRGTASTPLPARPRLRRLPCVALMLLCAHAHAPAQAQVAGRALTGANVQKLENGVVSVMSYTVAPM
jgi:hypothetical protein